MLDSRPAMPTAIGGACLTRRRHALTRRPPAAPTRSQERALFWLPTPGEPLATTPFAPAELEAFDRRVSEFRQRGWPLEGCWVS